MIRTSVSMGLAAVLGVAWVAPGFSAQAIQGAVGNVSTADGSALAGTAACRVYSLQDTTINANFGGSCLNNRCLRFYVVNSLLQPGGYICQGENTAAYASDQDNQIFYELVDGEVNAGAPEHIAFYGVQGQIASNAVLANPGDFRQPGCPGIVSVNCFERADSRFSRPTPLTSTFRGYGTTNLHEIRSIGGLSPVPNVKIRVFGTCPSDRVCLTWDEPETYAGAMKNGVPSPVKGIRLYRFDTSLSQCFLAPSGNSPDWTVVGDFPLGAGASGTEIPFPPPSDCVYFALTVRLVGPGGGANEIETGRVGGSGFVGVNSQPLVYDFAATRIVRLDARYMGRGIVRMTWTTGSEGGVEGYFVARGPSANGPFTRVSEQVAPRGDGSDYAYSDKVRPGLGRVVFYRIEIVKSGGLVESSRPISAELPPARRKIQADQ